MRIVQATVRHFIRRWCATVIISIGIVAVPSFAQDATPRDPAEPSEGKPAAKLLARPAGAIRREDVDEKSMQTLIHGLVACGTRLTLSS